MDPSKHISSPAVVLGKRACGPGQLTSHKNQCIRETPKSTQTALGTGAFDEIAGSEEGMSVVIDGDEIMSTIAVPVVPQVTAPVVTRVADSQGTKRKNSTGEESEEQRVRKRLRAERIDTAKAEWEAVKDEVEAWWLFKNPDGDKKTPSWVKLDGWKRKQAGEESRKKVYAVQKSTIDKWLSKKKDNKVQPTDWQTRLEMWEKANKQRNSRRAATKATPRSPSPALEAAPIPETPDAIGPQLPTRTTNMDSADEIQYWRQQMSDSQRIRDAWTHPMDKTCKKPDFPRDESIEKAARRADGKYLCAHKLPTLQRCCTQGLDRDAKKCSILKEMTLFRVKMERLIETGQLHPAHKDWIDWYDHRISEKEGPAAKKRNAVDAVLQNVQTVYDQAERKRARAAQKDQTQDCALAKVTRKGPEKEHSRELSDDGSSSSVAAGPSNHVGDSLPAPTSAAVTPAEHASQAPQMADMSAIPHVQVPVQKAPHKPLSQPSQVTMTNVQATVEPQQVYTPSASPAPNDSKVSLRQMAEKAIKDPLVSFVGNFDIGFSLRDVGHEKTVDRIVWILKKDLVTKDKAVEVPGLLQEAEREREEDHDSLFGDEEDHDSLFGDEDDNDNGQS
ncbi:hypothetical protein IAQ61_009372 [Plenodomus lingam]|uniref:Predicted protein n=1 Tax=Leptosphaeria maculans (strain JN3 / isolate v23.1.3 / race Av1-4-5-6-7-8) TaxID=985895 RepID=E4ZTX9_LEPMJ|nr:predicted protein [Plenodomus lingam JN3]KAH9863095.1 hypothetical protein IAQ61_009372 [Plenodomus lingam]CBX94689.1 predicted protein [Plenodomus lingam JN3]